MRSIIKKTLAALLVLAAALSLPAYAAAAEETKELFTIDREYNMTVSVVYDAAEPAVSFTAPNGTVIRGGSLRAERGEGYVVYYLDKAAPGTWLITYDKGENTVFEVVYASYTEPVTIGGLTVGEVNGSYLDYTYTVSSDGGGYLDFKLFAVITDASGAAIGERELDSWRDYDSGNPVQRSVYVGGLSDYSQYRLRLDVSMQNGVEEVYDSKVSDQTFAVSTGSAPAAVANVRAAVNVRDGGLTLDWSEWAVRNGEYIVAVFQGAAEEPLYFAETSGTDAHALFDAAGGSLRVELSYRDNGKTSATLTKTIPVPAGEPIRVTTPELTNSAQAVVEYNLTGGSSGYVSVNGREERLNLSGAGTFSVLLPEERNVILVGCYAPGDEYISYGAEYTVTVDGVPPTLRLPENKTALRVNAAEFTLAGVTEPGATVSVGEQTVTADETGAFVCAVALADGENIIRISVSDAAGNITSQSVVITRAKSADAEKTSAFSRILKYIPLAVSVAGSAAVLVAVLVITKRFGAAADKKLFTVKTVFAVSVAASAILAVVFGIMLAKYLSLKNLLSGEEYFDLAAKSIDEAFEAIGRKDVLRGRAVRSGAAFGAALLVAGASFAAARLLKSGKLAGRAEKVKKPEDARKRPSAKERNGGEFAGKKRDVSWLDADAPTSVTQRGEPQTPETEVPGGGTASAEDAVGTLICPNCGEAHDVPVKFCRKCGHKLNG